MAGLMLPRFALLIITIGLMFNVGDRGELVKGRYNNFSPFLPFTDSTRGKGEKIKAKLPYFFRGNNRTIQKV